MGKEIGKRVFLIGYKTFPITILSFFSFRGDLPLSVLSSIGADNFAFLIMLFNIRFSSSPWLRERADTCMGALPFWSDVLLLFSNVSYLFYT